MTRLDAQAVQSGTGSADLTRGDALVISSLNKEGQEDHSLPL